MSRLFSIIVPVYGVELYLDKCVNSILSQTFTDFEVILVDDGSKDNCPTMCDNYAQLDNRVKVIHKENGGIVSARQAGAELASGEYVVCVDGDDWISSEYLNAFASAIETHSPDVCCCGHYDAWEDKNIKVFPNERTGFYNKEDLEREIYPHLISSVSKEGFPHHLWAKIFRREIYVQQQLRVNTRLSMGEDAACVFPTVFMANSMYVMRDCLYYYRQNPSSITKVKKPFQCEGPEIIGKHLEASVNVQYSDFRQQIDRHVVYELFIVAASQFRKTQRYHITRKEVLSVLKTPYYREVISRCKYSKNWRNVLFLTALKFRLTSIMKFYCSLKL